MNIPDKSTVGGRIRYARRVSDLSMKDLAQQAGISTAYLQEVETGKKTPSDDVLDKIGQVLDIDPKLLREGFPPHVGPWPAAPKPEPNAVDAVKDMSVEEMARFLCFVANLRNPAKGLDAAVIYATKSCTLDPDEAAMRDALLARPTT